MIYDGNDGGMIRGGVGGVGSGFDGGLCARSMRGGVVHWVA